MPFLAVFGSSCMATPGGGLPIATPAPPGVDVALRDCIGISSVFLVSSRVRDGHLAVWIHSISGDDPGPVSEACVAQRLEEDFGDRAPLDNLHAYVSSAPISPFRDRAAFPYPIPNPSSGPTELTGVRASTVSGLGEELTRAVHANYDGQIGFFRFLDGFALVTRPEKVEADGKIECLTPQSGCDRWALDMVHQDKGWLDWSFLTKHLWTTPMLYRAFVFFASSRPTLARAQLESVQPTLAEVIHYNAASPELPESTASATAMHVFVAEYVFRQQEQTAPVTLLKRDQVTSGLSARLSLAGISTR